MIGVGLIVLLAGIVGLVKPSLLKLPNRWVAIIGIVVGFAMIGASGGDTPSTPAASNAVPASTGATAPKEPEAPANEEPKKDDKSIVEAVTETVSQKNATRKANEYLRIMAFSKKGLIEQLEFEGFSNEDATYAVSNVKANWKEQAAKKAKEYLNTMAFSRKGLIEQLVFEGYTTEEATHGVDAVGL